MNMTNEELEKELAKTQKSLMAVQASLSRVIQILFVYRVHMGINFEEFDKDYIEGKITQEEYLKQWKEQHNIENVFQKMFDAVGDMDKK